MRIFNGETKCHEHFFFLAVYFFYTRCFSLPLTLLSPFRLGPFDCYRHNKLLYWVFRGGHSIEPLFRRSLTYCTFMLKYFYKRCSMFYRVWCVCVYFVCWYCILILHILYILCCIPFGERLAKPMTITKSEAILYKNSQC